VGKGLGGGGAGLFRVLTDNPQVGTLLITVFG
jgi:hypothetical protein